MMNATKLLMLGTLLLVAPACRTSQPPPTDICTGDGFGGANCTLSDGSHVKKLPSELNHSWIIPDQKQAAAFTSWCYDASVEDVQKQMSQLEVEAIR